MTTTCATCSGTLPARAINAQYWVADPAEAKFGGHYERRDFCSTECVKAAPKYQKPAKPKAPKPQPVVYGDWAQLGAFLGHKAK